MQATQNLQNSLIISICRGFLNLNVLTNVFMTLHCICCLQFIVTIYFLKITCLILFDLVQVLPSKPSSYSELLYVSSLTSLLNSLGHMIKNQVTSSPGDFPKDFLAEWVELHALTIYKTFLPYFVDTAGMKDVLFNQHMKSFLSRKTIYM